MIILIRCWTLRLWRISFFAGCTLRTLKPPKKKELRESCLWKTNFDLKWQFSGSNFNFSGLKVSPNVHPTFPAAARHPSLDPAQLFDAALREDRCASFARRPASDTSEFQTRNDWLVVSIPLKNISQLGWLFPIYGKIRNFPNHQPDEQCGKANK